MIRSLAAASLAIVFTAIPAQAETDPQVLAACMIEHSSETDVATMKSVMLHALQDHEDEATASLLKLAFSATSIATGDCGMSLSDLDTPLFEDAMQIYGEHLGTVIMERALSFLGEFGE
ncbi:hypothetical protein [Hyphomonas sp.]|uniref:hypothetical protein n=1 Tax=Hyphomonas sp. TaxID=87 RepID=UPI0032421891